MNKALISLLALASATLATHAQTDIFIARHDETATGNFNQGRVRINATFDGTSLGQWGARGNAGTAGDGEVWNGFARYKMYERDLYNAVNGASAITWTTGLIQKEKNRAVDPVDGGHDVDVYLVLDPAGPLIPSGQVPGHLTAWDWANEFGLGYANTVYLGRVLQSEPMATEEEKTAENQIAQDSPAMRITYDLTAHLKDWIQQGLLTVDSTIAIGLVQRQAVISDGSGNPKFDDPNLYIHSQMVFEVGTAYLATTVGGTDTGPWAWSADLNKWTYVPDNSGWVYIPK